MSKAILYDLPSKGRCACWSGNAWKGRMMLNFKGIDYQTEWLEYPDIAPTLESYGIDPNTEGTPYSIPTVCLPNGTYVMESRKIAEALEGPHPSPPLHLDSEILPQVEAGLLAIYQHFFPVLVSKVPHNLLRPASVEYFERTRAQRYGMPLAQFGKEKGGEQAWEGLKEPLAKMAALLKAKGGPYFLGKTPSYADIVYASFLQFCKRIDETIFDRVLSHDAAVAEFYHACKQWLKKDD